MMETTHLRRLILLGLAGLLALASPGSAAAVFCVADGGHAAVEVLASPCCEDGSPSRAPGTILESPHRNGRDSACGPCVDFQLVPQFRFESQTRTAIPPCEAHATLAAAPTPGIAVTTGSRRTERIAAFPTLELLASVVLLT